MKLKHKAIMIALCSAAVLLGLTYGIFYGVFYGYVEEAQRIQISKDFEMVETIIENEKEDLNSILKDWAYWDDTYRFINDRNPSYVTVNLNPASLENLSLNMMLFANQNNEVIAYSDFDLKNEETVALIEKIRQNNFYSGSITDGEDAKTDLIILNGQPYLIASGRVNNSSRTATSNGSMVMFKNVDKEMTAYIEVLTGVNVEFREAGSAAVVLENQIVKREFAGKPYLTASRLQRDSYDEETILMTISRIEENYSFVKDQFNLFMASFILVLIVILSIDYFIVDRYFLKRIEKLIAFTKEVGLKRDTTLSIEMDGKDELKMLAVSINQMLKQINQANQSIKSNITKRKTKEEEVLFLSYSDPLTRLKNRDYMKMQFESISRQNESHYFIIMCDINGLKLTNDAFGHQEGDQVLIAVSNVLRRICRPTDIISRWPGDEFVILLKDITQEEVCQIIQEITNEIEKIPGFHLKISVAMGYAEKSEDLKRPEDVLNLAENRMYRNKLMESSSSRNATIRTLARTLHEKSTETEAHTMRIGLLSKALGSRLDLRKDQLDDLELLSLLHDIGKIGIPEYILDKPAKLSHDEWEIIKTHPEIGYRIAKSTPALEHIADYILAHHEKYDGTGYPNGLSAQDIPYLGRIITVVDSFDVMTHSRSYKKANDLAYAIGELKTCSGTQFDPEIAKVFLKMIEEEGLPVELEISIVTED